MRQISYRHNKDIVIALTITESKLRKDDILNLLKVCSPTDPVVKNESELKKGLTKSFFFSSDEQLAGSSKSDTITETEAWTWRFQPQMVDHFRLELPIKITCIIYIWYDEWHFVINYRGQSYCRLNWMKYKLGEVYIKIEILKHWNIFGLTWSRQ